MAKETPPPHDHSKPGTGGGDINPRTIGERQPVESLNADEAETDSLLYPYDADAGFPKNPRMPEQNAPPTVTSHPDAENPVLTGSDAGTEEVADPFIGVIDGTYHMLFEEIDRTNGVEDIGHATSPDGLNWTYDKTVLSLSDHLAYPHWFKYQWMDEWHMVPDRSGDGPGTFEIFSTTSASLDNWSLAETALNPSYTMSDPTPFYVPGDRWYMVVQDVTNSQKRLYYADEGKALQGRSWTEHGSSPIITGTTARRNGGRPLVYDNAIFLVYQDDNQEQTRVYRVEDISTSSFSQTEVQSSPVWGRTGARFGDTAGASVWNRDKAHHMDALMPRAGGSDVVAVDGHSGSGWSIGIATTSDVPHDGALAALTTATGIGAAWTDVPWDATLYDTVEGMDLSNDQFAVPKSGYWRFHAHLLFQFSGTSVSSAAAQLRINNETLSKELWFEKRQISQNKDLTLSATPPTAFPVEKGDVISVDAGQDSGSTVDVGGKLTTAQFGAEFVSGL